MPDSRLKTARFQLRRCARSAQVIGVLALLGACAPPAATLEARSLLRQGQVEAADRRIDQGLSRQPGDTELNKLKIQVQLRRGDLQAAVRAYRAWDSREGGEQYILRYLALAVLQWGLKHRDPAVRLAALQGVRRSDASPLEPEVVDRLADPDELVRTWAAVALFGTPTGAKTLQRQLGSRSAAARAVAAAELGRIAGEAAVRPLARLVSDPDVRVRLALARGLPATGSKRARPLLLKLVADRDPGVRAAALTALGTSGAKGEISAVRGALKDPHHEVRTAALLALADLQGQAATSTLAAAVAVEDLPRSLRLAVRLARLGLVQPVLNAVARGLVDRSWTVRAAACNAAGSVNDAVALRLVRRALRDPQPTVRLAAARAVFARAGVDAGSQRVARGVLKLACAPRGPGDAVLLPDRESLCLQAAELLARGKQADGIEALRRLARRASAPEDRIAALQAALRADSPLNLAVDLLPDKHPRVTVESAIEIYRRVK